MTGPTGTPLGAMRPQDVDWTVDRIERELEYRRARASLQFPIPGPDECERHLLQFVIRNFPGYTPGWVHVRICEALERFVREIEAGGNPRLILTMPPRHGKSEIVSRQLPLWYLGRNPGHEVVVASYGQDLADEMSRGARNYRDRCLDMWPHLAPRPRAKDGIQFWETQGGGSYNAVGAGGPLTGRGFHLGIIDDPIKNAEQAESEVEREKVWNWYQSTFYTRAAPASGILVMATRWHTDDLIGRLLKASKLGEGDAFEVLDFPALAEADERHPDTGALLRSEGEALHAARFPVARLGKIRKAVGERYWLALYMCRPTSETGGIFQRSWYGVRHLWDPRLPPERFDEIALSIDTNLVVNVRKGSAFASLGVWGRYGWTRFLRLDERRERYAYTDLRKASHELCLTYNPSFVLVELAAVGPALVSDLEELGWTVIPFKVSQYGSKEQRAEVSARCHEAGQVELMQAPWTEAWIEEHVDFPLGKFKDRVDEGAQMIIYWRERARIGGTSEQLITAHSLLAELMSGRR